VTLAPIPIGTIEMPKPRKVLVLPDGNALTYNERFQRMLWSRHTLSEVEANHAREAERQRRKKAIEEYVEGWRIAA
jgi:polynucleotide 5'-kinase involved in rRNA processing